MHYSTNDLTEPTAAKAAGPSFGYAQSEKIAEALKDVTALQAAKGSLDAVMILGDLSTDDCGYRSLSINYVNQFKLDFMDQLSVPSYALAGNHDSYTSEEWEEIFGYGRQYTVELGGAKFIMLDTFEEGPTELPTGNAYRGMDEDNMKFLTSELEKNFEGPIFLCAHWFTYDFSEDFKNLLKQYPNVVCLFHGHSHKNGVSKKANYANKYLVNTGGYAYNANADENGNYDYNAFYKAYAWGYQVLEWSDKWVRTYHVKPARSYVDSSGVTHTIEKDLIEGKTCFSFSK